MNEPDPALPTPEPERVTVVCPECRELIVIKDIHAWVQAQHLAVCVELASLRAE